MPTPRPQASVNKEADRLELAMSSLRPKLSVEQEIAVWDTWQDHGLAAANHVLSAMKEARSPAVMRQKATAADEFDALGQDFARILRARAMAQGGDKASEVKGARTYLAQLSGQRNGGDGTLGDEEKARVTKSTGDQLGDLLTGAVRSRQIDASNAAAQAQALETKRS